AMYLLTPGIGAYVIAVVTRVVPTPEPFGLWMGISIGSLFTLTSLYSTALMTRKPRVRTPDQQRLRIVMIGMFIALSVVFVALVVLREQRLLGMILERI